MLGNPHAVRIMYGGINRDERRKIKQGAVMVTPTDEGITPRILFMADHTVKEAPSVGSARTKGVASRRL